MTGSVRVEQLRATDRGLAARMVERLAAVDPSLAPEVADGSIRATTWLADPKPLYAAIAVATADADAPKADSVPRRVIGYASADTTSGAVEVTRLLIDRDLPAGVDEGELSRSLSEHALRSARAVLEAAAERREAHAAASAVEVAVENRAPRDGKPSDVLTEPLPVTYPPVPVRRRRLAPGTGTVAVTLAGAGVVAVYSVAIGLGGDLGFLDREPPRLPAAATPAGRPTDGAQVDGLNLASAPVRGQTGTENRDRRGNAAPQPTPSPDPTPGPGPIDPTDPPVVDGPVSARIDPALFGVLTALDSLSGGRTDAVTEPGRQRSDETTDILDEVLGGAPPPAPR